VRTFLYVFKGGSLRSPQVPLVGGVRLGRQLPGQDLRDLG